MMTVVSHVKKKQKKTLTIPVATTVPGADISDVVKSDKGHGDRWSDDKP